MQVERISAETELDAKPSILQRRFVDGFMAEPNEKPTLAQDDTGFAVHADWHYDCLLNQLAKYTPWVGPHRRSSNQISTRNNQPFDWIITIKPQSAH